MPPKLLVTWKWKNDLRKKDQRGEAWESYPASQSTKIEAAFQKGAEELKLDATYSIDFKNMIQVRNDDYDRQRDVQRVELPAVGPGTWLWKADLRKKAIRQEAWEAYEESEAARIESAYQQGCSQLKLTDTHSIDFKLMVQYRTGDKTRQREIQRTEGPKRKGPPDDSPPPVAAKKAKAK